MGSCRKYALPGIFNIVTNVYRIAFRPSPTVSLTSAKPFHLIETRIQLKLFLSILLSSFHMSISHYLNIYINMYTTPHQFTFSYLCLFIHLCVFNPEKYPKHVTNLVQMCVVVVVVLVMVMAMVQPQVVLGVWQINWILMPRSSQWATTTTHVRRHRRTHWTVIGKFHKLLMQNFIPLAKSSCRAKPQSTTFFQFVSGLPRYTATAATICGSLQCHNESTSGGSLPWQSSSFHTGDTSHWGLDRSASPHEFTIQREHTSCKFWFANLQK